MQGWLCCVTAMVRIRRINFLYEKNVQRIKADVTR